MKFGDNLRNLRSSKRLSQEKLAEKVGVSRQSVSKWECGESYPEMDNILTLCNIFHCTINNLVHEDLSDIDALDEEVKMSVVKFNKEKQNRMKGLSRTLYILARVGKIAAVVGTVCLVVIMLISPYLLNNIQINNDSITVFGHQIGNRNANSEMVLQYSGSEYAVQKTDEAFIINRLTEIANKHSNLVILTYYETAMAFLVATCILIYMELKHLEKLFLNIYNGDTPFTMDNVNHIKKMAILMIATILLPKVSGSIAQQVISEGATMRFQLNDFLYCLFLFSMAYIFEYGHLIQLDSKGRMYGEEE